MMCDVMHLLQGIHISLNVYMYVSGYVGVLEAGACLPV